VDGELTVIRQRRFVTFAAALVLTSLAAAADPIPAGPVPGDEAPVPDQFAREEPSASPSLVRGTIAQAPWRAPGAVADEDANGQQVARAARAGPPEPRYVVEPCCDLCSRAADRRVYSTKFLEAFATLVQGKDGWLFRSDDLRTTFGPDEDGYRELKRFGDALKKRGVDLVVVYQPTRGMLHPDKLPGSLKKGYNRDLATFSFSVALERFRKAGLVAPDLTAVVRESNDPPYFFRGDHHWTPYGSQRTARIVADAIRQLPSYQKLPKTKFTTERIGVLAKKGTMYKAATLLCGHGYAEQYVDRYATSSDGGNDLFGDQAIPPVALMGTSNSDSAYNFAGFLEEYLGVDILNAAISGGRHDGSLLQYLPSDEFQKTPPKIMIWEIETNHNLSQRMFYRQVIPLVTNGCRTKQPVLSRKAVLKGHMSEVLFNGGGRVMPLVSKHYMLDLQFNDPNVRQIQAVVWYTNGSKETIDLKYSPYVDGRGRFVAELRSDLDWGDRTFMSLDLHRPDAVREGVEVTAQICAKDPAPGQQQAAK
jgi:alginate biosynthesis protein AlgX